MTLATRTWSLAALGGVMTALASPPLSAWPIVLLSLAPLYFLCAHATPRLGFARGALCGFFLALATFWWFVPTAHRFGDLHWLLAVPVGIVLMAAQGLAFGVVGWMVAVSSTSRADRSASRVPWISLLVLPLATVGVQGVWPTVFPWHLGYSLANAPWTVQGADLLGYGFATFLVALTSAILVVSIDARGRRRRMQLATVLVGCWAVVAAYGIVRIKQVDAMRAAAPTIVFGLVQPNFAPTQREAPQGEKRADRLARLHAATDEVATQKVDVVLWPESAYPFRLAHDRIADFSESARERVGPLSVPLLFGSRSGGGQILANSVYLRQPDGRFAARYDKIHLVPFGETIPFHEVLRPIWRLVPNITQMAAGERPVTFQVASADIGPLICVEDLVPSHGLALVRAGADVLVNFTNDSWFGTAPALQEHLLSASFRSIESRRDLVRVTLTGVSAHVDAVGRIRWAGPVHDLTEQAAPETFVVRASRLKLPVRAMPRGFVLACLALAGFLASRGLVMRRRLARGAPASEGPAA